MSGASLSTGGRGRPVRSLALLLGAWCVARAALLLPDPHEMHAPAHMAAVQIREPAVPRSTVSGPGVALSGRPLAPPQPVPQSRAPIARIEPLVPAREDFDRPTGQPDADRPAFAPGMNAAGHNLLWMAAMRALPIPQVLADRLRETADPRSPDLVAKAPGAWHGDGWALWRNTDGDAAVQGKGVLMPQLGGSQAGLSIRRSLSDARGLEAVLRLSSAADRWSATDGEVAAGLRLKPHAGLPVFVQAEARAHRSGGATRVAPAAFVAGGLDDVRLPARLRLRAFAEAGAVGGDWPTGFADGQIAVDREVAGFDLGRVAAGVGGWGGAQRGAARVDVGPTAAVEFDLGATRSRIQIDYRFRIAGNAEPGEGPAVTLSSGF